MLTRQLILVSSICCCLANGLIGMSRLTEEMIIKRKADFVVSQERIATVRYYAKIGGYCAAAAATVGGLYFLCKTDHVPQISPVTVETLSKEVEALKIQIQGPNFGSIAWFKSAAANFLLSHLFMLNMVERLAKAGYKFVNSIFYTPTLSWYLCQHSKLGIIKDVNDDGIMKKHFAPGIVKQEIMYHLTKDDNAAQPAVKDAAQYHKGRIKTNINTIVDDVANLIAFLQYKVDLWNAASQQPAALEAADRARYIFNLTNSMVDSLESALMVQADWQEQKKLLLLPIKNYFVELEQVLTSFARFEDDCRN